jgi:hypothetical protein
VTPCEVQQLLLDRLGLRVGPEMAAYVLRSWEARAARISVIATDGRTGIPLASGLRPDMLSDAPTCPVAESAT